MKILLVEDQPDVCEYISGAILLKRPGSTVDVDGSLLKALDRLAAGSKYDVILLDLLLPDAQDVDAVKLLSISGNKIPVVAISGATELKRKAIEAGAHDFFPKGEQPTVGGYLCNMLEAAVYRDGVRPFSGRTEPEEACRLRGMFSRLRQMADEKEQRSSKACELAGTQ